MPLFDTGKINSYPKVAARKNTNQSLTLAAVTTIIYNSEDIDTHNIYDASTGNIVITSATEGSYYLSASATVNFSHPTTTGNAILLLTAYKNSTGLSEIGRGIAQNTNSFTIGASGGILLPNLIAGDTISIRLYPTYISGGSATVSSTALNNLAFYKLL
jgi:hypothetical protein